MKCQLQSVCPVHIGSGDSYGPSEYLPVTLTNKKGEKVKTFKRIDVSRYYISLDESRRDEFISELSRPDFNLKNFDTKISNTYRKYLAIDKTTSRPKVGQDIEETIKTLNKAYIPGSSIKGAIKTALLYNLFDFDDVDKVKRFINSKPWDFRREYNKFMDEFFAANGRGPSAQRDVLKFLQVSDTSDAKQIGVYDIYSVMAAQFNGRNTNVPYRKNKSSREATISYFETVDAGNKLEFTINNNYSENVHSTVRFGNKLDLLDIDNIKKSIYNFSKDYIEHELEFSDKYGIDSLNAFYKRYSKMNTLDSPLLKVGAGSGFLATTLAMKIEDYDPQLYDTIRRQKRGYEYSFPKSRKITKKDGRPLGWVKLSFDEE